MKLKKNEILVLRTCGEDMKAHGGFVWPRRGYVEAPDWISDYKCGHGLHGLPWGVGDVGYFIPYDGHWLVVKVATGKGIYNHGAFDMMDKCKFKSGYVVYCGDRAGAIGLIQKHAPPGTAIPWANMTGGDRANMTGGDKAVMTGGDWATMTGGYRAVMTGGDGAVMTGGDWAVMTGGDKATMTGGYRAVMTGGDWATMTGGNYATMTGGDWAVMTGGDKATMTGGDKAMFVVQWFDPVKKIVRVKTKIITEKTAGKKFTIKAGKWVEL